MLKNTTSTPAQHHAAGSLPAAGPGRLVKVIGETHFMDSKLRSEEKNLFILTQFEGSKKAE